MKDDKRVKQIQKLLDVAEGNLASARHLLLDITGEKKTGKTDHKESAKDLSILDEGKVIEGIFDGEQMMAPDGKKYPVPANYASKSKLVEGDTLKLTISDDGSLIYKQIKPVERRNLVGALSYDGSNYSVLADGKNYKVLFASVTYYKGEPGNQVSIIIPASGNSEWAAMESVIHDHNKDEKEDEKPRETPKKKLDLPEENKEILKEVKESFDKSSKEDKRLNEEAVETPKMPASKEKLEQTEPEISDNMTIQEASKASNNEQRTDESETQPPSQNINTQNTSSSTSEEHPNIHNQSAAFMDEPSPYTESDKESNSLGEEAPATNIHNNIKELEI